MLSKVKAFLAAHPSVKYILTLAFGFGLACIPNVYALATLNAALKASHLPQVPLALILVLVPAGVFVEYKYRKVLTAKIEEAASLASNAVQTVGQVSVSFTEKEINDLKAAVKNGLGNFTEAELAFLKNQFMDWLTAKNENAKIAAAQAANGNAPKA